MKIFIRHIHDTYNYGSMMMAMNTITYLNEKIQGPVDFYIDATEQIHADRLIEGTGVSSIYLSEVKQKPVKNLLVKNLVRTLELLQYGKRTSIYDAVIVLGGDDLSEYYGKKGFIISSLKSYSSHKNTKLFLLGQSVGPFTGFTKVFAKRILQRLNLFTRDPKCSEYMREELGVTNVKDSRDLAFIELPTQNNNDLTILEKYNLEPENYITIVPSGLVKHYTSNEKDYFKSYIDIIERLQERNEKIVMLSHVYGDYLSRDNYSINELKKRLSSEALLKITFIEELIQPMEARTVLGNGVFTITGRMHAAISTFEMIKPALSLSYSVKYEGVIGRGLDMQELIIESATDKLWSNSSIVDVVLDKVDYIKNNYRTLLEKIKTNVDDCSGQAQNQLEYICSSIVKGDK